MEAWDEALGELRRQYLAGCRGRLARIDLGLARLGGEAPDGVSLDGAAPDGAAPDGAALAALRRELHSLAGSGAVYGLPEVSRLGDQGERHCLALAERSGGEGDLAALRRTVEALRAEIAAGEPASPPAAPSGVTEAEAAAPPPRHVLLVAPDGGGRRRLARALEGQGLATRIAGTRRAALASFASFAPAGVIVAADLPDGSGYELVEACRDGAAEGGPPILVVGLREDGGVDRVEAMRCGADDCCEAWASADEPASRLRQLIQAQSGAARVLSVEDDPEQAAYLRTVLAAAGYEFRCAPGAAAFEAELAAFRPDIVLMDILLDGANGYELARRVRQDDERATLPIVFLTTEGQLAARIASARVGGDDHLVKPVAPELLLSAIAARLARRRALQSLVERDGLTRLLNPAAFLDRARAAVAEAAREPRRRTAWIMLDLDHFKSINDRWGHPVGDAVLTAFASLLSRRLRGSDAVGRCGGEEFAVLVGGLGERDAVRLADRLREEFHALDHAAPGGGSFRASCSAGIAFLEPGMGLAEWRERADRALYRAKALGRDRVEIAPQPFSLSSGGPLGAAGAMAVA